MSVDFISTRKIEAVLGVTFDATDHTLSFDEQFTLVSVLRDNEVLVCGGLGFSLIFEGLNLPSGLVFIARVDFFPPIPVTISADGTRGTTPFLKTGDTPLMQLSKTYTVSSLTKEDRMKITISKEGSDTAILSIPSTTKQKADEGLIAVERGNLKSEEV
ncbi:hypothetical protein BLNAU_21422 [Blattamonas nauphoetae]|uniref:Uncharacterized protein n=1 Tax=Blattamonas nauphoetae TaxID=2049346 RepID=A0ABQ9WX18_9EUKA|nr:hypothetical protein BLNAU_21422 [Blattamonas nauphoetae]